MLGHLTLGRGGELDEQAPSFLAQLVAGDPIVLVPGLALTRRDARMAQHGPDTERIDGWYRLHYLQWTGHRGIDRGLALVGLAWIWAVVAPGLVLFVRALRRRRPASSTPAP